MGQHSWFGSILLAVKVKKHFDVNSICGLLRTFENFVIKTANEIALEETRPQCDWFTQSKYILLLQIGIHNKAFEDQERMRTKESRIKLKETRAELRKVIWKWQTYIANKC